MQILGVTTLIDYYAVYSVSGAHIGLWKERKIAEEVFSKAYPDGKLIHLQTATLRVPWAQRMFYPIVMPLDSKGRGPASVEDGTARKLTWEVWDRNLTSYGSYTTLGEAVVKAEELNSTYGHCVDEGCPHYGSPHTHLEAYEGTLPFYKA